jgi:hypothetical protein
MESRLVPASASVTYTDIDGDFVRPDFLSQRCRCSMPAIWDCQLG